MKDEGSTNDMVNFTQSQTSAGLGYSSLQPPSGSQPVPRQGVTSQPPASSVPGASPNPTKASLSSHTPLQLAPIDVSSTTEIEVPEESSVIEKEWVTKAQTIVEKTQKDPFSKSQQISLLKTDYLKKRYGKMPDKDGQKR